MNIQTETEEENGGSNMGEVINFNKHADIETLKPIILRECKGDKTLAKFIVESFVCEDAIANIYNELGRDYWILMIRTMIHHEEFERSDINVNI